MDAGVTSVAGLAWEDEMRLGLRGLVRRVWAPRGVKVRQSLQLVYEWRYLVLAVDGLRGRLWWRWTPSMRKEPLRAVLDAWHGEDVTVLVWDGAPAHQARLVREAGLVLVRQPPAAPELNPAERVFEELRRAVEGRIYATLDEKVEAVERVLRALAADPSAVQRLAGWRWIQDALAAFAA